MLRRLFQSLSDSEIYYFIFKSVTSAVPFFCFWEILQVRHVQICFQPGGKPFSLRLHWLLQKIHASLGLTVICSSSLKSDLVLFFLVLKSERCNRFCVSTPILNWWTFCLITVASPYCCHFALLIYFAQYYFCPVLFFLLLLFITNFVNFVCWAFLPVTFNHGLYTKQYEKNNIKEREP